MNAERLFHQFIPKHFSRPKIKLYQIITYQILGLLIFRYRWEMTTYTIGKISCPPGFGYPNLGRDIPFFKHLFLHFIKAIIEWRCFGIFPPQYIWVYRCKIDMIGDIFPIVVEIFDPLFLSGPNQFYIPVYRFNRIMHLFHQIGKRDTPTLRTPFLSLRMGPSFIPPCKITRLVLRLINKNTIPIHLDIFFDIRHIFVPTPDTIFILPAMIGIHIV